MQGDFSRITFDARKHFTRVLMQQGRVQLDADWNEQAAILLHYLQTLAADLIGPHGGPTENLGFGVVDVTTLPADEQARLKELDLLPLKAGDFLIGKGHYYVDGVLCENADYVRYSGQRDYLLPEAAALDDNTTSLAYLDVWERNVTAIEDNSIREAALGGPDTATRAQIVWQVKTTSKLPDESAMPTTINTAEVETQWPLWIEKWQPAHRGQLKARTEEPGKATDPCVIAPEARYRGAENQLYRVEIHSDGPVGKATFKWSRENGSVTFPIRALAGTLVTLDHLGRDRHLGLQVGDWVEIVDDDSVRQERAEPERLFQIDAIDQVEMSVTLEVPDGVETPVYDEKTTKHPLLRRWDHKAGVPTHGGLTLSEGAALIVESDKPEEGWLTLEDGVQIQLQKPASGPHQYRAGDYWLIPARAATGDVEWPKDEEGDAIAQSPQGVEHHYAPLAVIAVAANGKVTTAVPLRRTITPLGQ